MASVLDEIFLEEYARSLRSVQSINAELANLPKGSIVEKPRSKHGKTYCYLQYREGAHVKSRYIPRDMVADVQRKLDRRAALISEKKDEERTLAQLRSAFGRSRTVELQEIEVEGFLTMLDELQCLDHVVLIGSWAEFMYEHANVIENYSASIRTRDVDFLIRNQRRPQPAVSLLSAARERGYGINTDYLNGINKIRLPGGLEVEFLIAKMGAGEEDALKTNLGVTAESLRHLELLAADVRTTEYRGLQIRIPTPEAYTVQKMIVNHDRKPEKREKDARAVMRLWPHLDSNHLEQLIGRLSKKDKRAVIEFMQGHGLSIDSGMAATKVPESLISIARAARRKDGEQCVPEELAGWDVEPIQPVKRKSPTI